MKTIKYFLILALIIIMSPNLSAQAYKFTDVVKQKATPVKSQGSTGTCWCFASVSFMESELIRTGKGEFDLSEMFIVRHNYNKRMQDNYLRRGEGNISQGSIAHMAFNIMEENGLMPEESYSGINYNSTSHNHNDLSSYIKGIADVSVKMRNRSTEYLKLQEALFDIYLGKIPEKFTYNGKEYNPITFREFLNLKRSDYVELTSFTHHPYYQLVPLEISDNWDHATLYNLPLDEFMGVIDNALNNGYTVCWDGDVSEPGYVFGMGISIIPLNENIKRDQITSTDTLIAEVQVTPELRQKWFESFKTTDDHLEHITGITKDQNGNKYYITKNSWGTGGNSTGYHNMSESYVRGKTVSIMVHKNSIPKEIRGKLGIK